MKTDYVKLSLQRYDELVENEKCLELFKKSTTVYLRYTGITQKVFTDDEAVVKLIKFNDTLQDEIHTLQDEIHTLKTQINNKQKKWWKCFK